MKRPSSIETDETPVPENPAIARARKLVLEHGWNSTSFQIVNPGISRWFSADGDAVVGFVSAAGVRVVVGAPICDLSRLDAVLTEFEANASAARQQVCYFGAEARLEGMCAGSERYSKFLVGAQPVWDPADWASLVSVHRSVRSQLNRARNKGVVVTEWPIEKAREHPDLQKCLQAWLDSKGLPPLHFMVETDTLARLENRRVFVAGRGDHIYGFVIISPVARRNGWLFEQFPHRPGAPNGTVELMIDTAMQHLARDGFDYATFGISPLSTRADLAPFPSPVWLRVMLAWLRKHGQRFYNFDGLDAFKAKFRPESWEPVFAVSNEPQVSFKTLYAIASAFSGNAPFRMVAGGSARAVATEVHWLKRRLIH